MAIIDVPELAAALGAADPPTVIDIRWAGPVLAKPQGDEYEQGHVPGAALLDLDRDVCGPPGAGGRHPLPDPDRLQEALRGAGVRAGHPVIVYDGGDGVAAARLWWTLRWAGHDPVRVLDGGYRAWVTAGQPIETGAAPDRTGDFEVTPGSRPVLDADAAEALGRSGLLLDARSAERYRGGAEPIDPVAGHIPGAVNLAMSRLTDPDGRLRPAAELRAIFDEAGGVPGGPAPVGAYCGSGVTAAHTLLALATAGIDDVALYVGSWSNWVDDPLRPIATGESP